MKKMMMCVLLCSTMLATSVSAGLLDAKLALQYEQYLTASREFSSLAEQGNPAAMYYLGYMYQNGLGVPKSLPTAYNYYKQADAAFYTPAAAPLGRMLLQGGNGVPFAPNQAVPLLKKAALSGSAEAAYDLGMIYQKGLGSGVNAIEPNYNQAYGYFLLAALRGDKQAQYQLSKMYLVGRGVPQDFQKTVTWLSRSAHQGYVRAQLELASLRESDPRLKNEGDAYAWYSILAAYNSDVVGTRAANKRNELAEKLSQKVLAQQQLNVRQWRPRTAAESVPEEERSSTAIPSISGFNDAYTLQQILSLEGVLPQDGQRFGVTQDMLDAAEATGDLVQLNTTIDKAMKRGAKRAGAYYGDVLQKRLHNEAEAFKWYKRGAEAGDTYAQYQLAKFYCEGRSVEPDAAECYAWLLTVQNAQDPMLNALTQQAIAAVRANATPLELERGEAKMSGHEKKDKKEEKGSVTDAVLDFL